jgi:cell division protein ZapA (FtsZ GTPase activity inhibitor)
VRKCECATFDAVWESGVTVQVLGQKGELPTYERMKPVHEHLEEAATLLDSAIRKGTVLLDTTPLKDDLASLRLECADLLLM